MNILPLGTNGFFSSFGRQTACYAIPHGDTLILLDAGSGLFRLAEPQGQELLKGVTNVHLFLSHYHLDHTMGLYSAFLILKKQDVTVFAPGGIQQIASYMKMRNLPKEYEKQYPHFHFQEIRDGKKEMEDYAVSVRRQDHRGEGSLAFRFYFLDGELAYVTDSEPTDEGVAFVQRVPLLLHEHTFTGDDALKNNTPLTHMTAGGHVTTVGAAIIATQAQVGKLFLIHHNPFADEKMLKHQEAVAKSIFPQSHLSQDLSMIVS
jgi:ribonuclease BN (tRNA processing enzyme)